MTNDYTENLDNFLLRNSLTTGKITVSNVDSLVEDGSLDKAKISNLNVDTITVSPTGYIRSGKISFTDIVNSGWYLDSQGFYLGKAADVTKLKFTTSTGALELVGTVIDGTSTVGGRTASTLAGAINPSGNLITNVINTNLNTSAKTILGSFTFGTSGAITMNTDSNNGIWLSPTGILGKKAGVNTFTVDTNGNATFSGNITGSTGTFGNTDLNSGGITVREGGKITLESISGVSLSSIDFKETGASDSHIRIMYIPNYSPGFNAGELQITPWGTSTQFNTVRIGMSGIPDDQPIDLRVTGTIYGNLDGLTGYYNNVNDIIPADNDSYVVGNSSYRFNSAYINNVFIGSSYLNYQNSKITSHTDFSVLGSIYTTGAIECGTARIRVGTTDFYPTTGGYDSSRYYLRS